MARRPKVNGAAHGAFGKSIASLPKLDAVQRLKLARGILDETCTAVGAGYLLVMFVPGSDNVMRSIHGIDTKEEAQALLNDVVAFVSQHAQKIQPPQPPAPEATP